MRTHWMGGFAPLVALALGCGQEIDEPLTREGQEADEVADARSPISTTDTERPRPAASRAIPHPLIPPPTIKRSPTGAEPVDTFTSSPDHTTKTRCANFVNYFSLFFYLA